MSTLLEDVCIGILMHGSDRGALVRPATDVCPAGVLILLLSRAAELRFAEDLYSITSELGFEPVQMPDGTIHDGRPPGVQLTMLSSVGSIFSDCDASPIPWLSFILPFGKVEVVGTVFVGPVCERVAEFCTRNGAPCSLDPKRAAKGWEIERTIGR